MKHKIGGTGTQRTRLDQALVGLTIQNRKFFAPEILALADATLYKPNYLCIMRRHDLDIALLNREDSWRKLVIIFNHINKNFEDYSTCCRYIVFQWFNPPEKQNRKILFQIGEELNPKVKLDLDISFSNDNWQKQRPVPNSKKHAIHMLRAYKTELDKRLENSDRSAAPEPTETCCTIC